MSKILYQSAIVAKHDRSKKQLILESLIWNLILSNAMEIGWL